MTTETRFRVEGMDCAACAAKIDTAVRRLAGVEEVSISVTAGTMAVRHAEDSDLGALARQVTGLGYALRSLDAAAAPHAHHHDHDHGHDHDHDHDHHHDPVEGPWWRAAKARLTLASGAALILATGLAHLLPALAPFLFVAAMLVGLVPIARRAVMAARAGSPFTIESLMTIAAIGAVLIGAAEEGATVVFLFLVGELLEGVAAGRARASIASLTELVPATALVERDGATVKVPAAEVEQGEVVLVRPGDRIPADGSVLAGEGTVDESPVTGESVPVAKRPDDAVFAGTVNGAAALRIRVTAAAQDNTIARIVRLVERAQESKAPTERLIDRFARRYTPGVVALAALVAVLPPLLGGADWVTWIYRGLAILLIGCPCALVISTPAAIAAALAKGARHGLLMKGGAVLERLGHVTVAAFDKTGTLTTGQPEVTDLLAFALPEDEVLRLAAALEAGSSHPLASAILAAAGGIALPPAEGARALGGKGVAATVEGRALFLGAPGEAGLSPDQEARIAALHGQGKTVAVLVADGVPAGAIAMRDAPRPDAAAGLRALAAQGVRALVLTGDNPRAAAAIGGELGIEIRAGLLPADKQRIVRELRQEGAVVAKIGDGINDAPALAEADIGIAMGGGTAVALETADAALLHGRVADVAAMVALSRRALANIHQNIAIALGLKAVFLVTTVAGLTGLWPAILADTGATVLVTLNALRLLR